MAKKKNRGTPPGDAPVTLAELPEVNVSETTLEDTFARAVRFLRGVGTSAVISTLLARRGYGDAAHQLGWSLVHGASGYAPGVEPPRGDLGIREAAAEVNAIDEDVFRLVRAALTHNHPAQAKFVLAGIAASPDPGEAVTNLGVLLGRLAKLESGKKREDTREADKAALATLAARKLDAAERARLGVLVAKATKLAPAAGTEVAAAEAARAEAQRAALVRLRAWYEEWSEIARTVVKRRDHLVTLGLAKRRTREDEGEDEANKPDEQK